MSAEVETMFSVREMPWHREGVILGDYPGSWAEARKSAGLEWDPIANPNYGLDGIDDDGREIFKMDEDWKRVVRSDTGALLAVRQSSYQIIDHADMGLVVEAVLNEPNVKWETAGSLQGGRSVWCLAMLDEPIVLPGDTSLTYPYLAMTTRHDGMGAMTLRATAVRIVCANTFRAAEMEGERSKATFSFHHTKNWKDNIDQARAAVTGARREIAEYVELATELLDIPVTPRQREMFVREFIPSPPDGLISDRVMNNIETARGLLRAILASPTTEGIAHTAYGLVQAGGEYADHARLARTWESKLGRTLLNPEPLKRRALVLARAAATA
jgi:phage/plasmid-like protein (TIGR03299 family)